MSELITNSSWNFQRNVQDLGTYTFSNQSPDKSSKPYNFTLTIFLINVFPDRYVTVMQKVSSKSKTYSMAAGLDLGPGCPLANIGQTVFLSFSLLSFCYRHEWSAFASPSNTKCPQTKSVQRDE